MDALSTDVKEILRKVEDIDQERWRLWVRRRQLQRELWWAEKKEKAPAGCSEAQQGGMVI